MPGVQPSLWLACKLCTNSQFAEIPVWCVHETLLRKLISMRSIRGFLFFLAGGVCTTVSVLGHAQESNCKLGLTSLEYRLSRAKTDGSGTIEVSGEGTLGLPAGRSVPFLHCTFAFAEHYWWSMNLASDRRSGQSLVQVKQMLFGFIPITVGMNTSTKLKLDALQLGVGRWVIESDSVSLGIQGGIHLLDYSLSIHTPTPLYSMDSKGLGATVFGGVVASYKHPVASLSIEFNYSSINRGDKKITFLDSGWYAAHKLSPHLTGGLAYLRREIRIDSQRGTASSDGVYRMNGPYLFVQSSW